MSAIDGGKAQGRFQMRSVSLSEPGGRILTVDAASRIHFLPAEHQTHHELSPLCWCEPAPTEYIPDDAIGAEHYHGYYHHVAN